MNLLTNEVPIFFRTSSFNSNPLSELFEELEEEELLEEELEELLELDELALLEEEDELALLNEEDGLLDEEVPPQLARDSEAKNKTPKNIFPLFMFSLLG